MEKKNSKKTNNKKAWVTTTKNVFHGRKSKDVVYDLRDNYATWCDFTQRMQPKNGKLISAEDWTKFYNYYRGFIVKVCMGKHWPPDIIDDVLVEMQDAFCGRTVRSISREGDNSVRKWFYYRILSAHQAIIRARNKEKKYFVPMSDRLMNGEFGDDSEEMEQKLAEAGESRLAGDKVGDNGADTNQMPAEDDGRQLTDGEMPMDGFTTFDTMEVKDDWSKLLVLLAYHETSEKSTSDQRDAFVALRCAGIKPRDFGILINRDPRMISEDSRAFANKFKHRLGQYSDRYKVGTDIDWKKLYEDAEDYRKELNNLCEKFQSDLKEHRERCSK
ncbi:MAG: hypothetical protein MJ025_05115 [Victivallaceae bacterium]|nr:hypothetical protein [Victivallaceae bacterium]